MARDLEAPIAHLDTDPSPTELIIEAEEAASNAIGDIHPRTPVRQLSREFPPSALEHRFPVTVVSAVTGMSIPYINRAIQTKARTLDLSEVFTLLDMDAFSETFVPRSMVPSFLLSITESPPADFALDEHHALMNGDARELIPRLPKGSISTVVTSTPYWGTRLYAHPRETTWADGETSVFGHEQTPEGFIRHSVELLFLLKPVLVASGSIWWNLMDTYNTRTQIRSNAAETLRAMQGKDGRSWGDHAARRYSAGHSFLEDGEQCLIPQRVAERASRIGYWIKSIISWKKLGSMPETVESRVTRELEYILHLSLQRTPYFDKTGYAELPPRLGGRNERFEAEKLTDIWCLPTTSGTDQHGAQFPLALPARCIALTSRPGDRVLDPFVGGGTTSVAAELLGRQSCGFDVSDAYLATAREKIATAERGGHQLRLV